MKYHLRYKIEAVPEGFDKEEALRDGCGAATAIILHSILFPEDGSYGHITASLDGRTGQPLSSMELFKAWTMMAHEVAAHTDLEPGRRALAANVQNAMSTHVLTQRGVPSLKEWFEAVEKTLLWMVNRGTLGEGEPIYTKLKELSNRYRGVITVDRSDA